MIFAVISDAVQIWTLLLAFLGTVFTGIMAYLMARLKIQQADAAVEVTKAAMAVEKVKETLAVTTTEGNKKLAEIAEVAHETHALVNSAMGRALKATAVALRRLAEGGTDDDLAAAEAAEQALAQHNAKQKIVDAGKS